MDRTYIFEFDIPPNSQVTIRFLNQDTVLSTQTIGNGTSLVQTQKFQYTGPVSANKLQYQLS